MCLHCDLGGRSLSLPLMLGSSHMSTTFLRPLLAHPNIGIVFTIRFEVVCSNGRHASKIRETVHACCGR